MTSLINKSNIFKIAIISTLFYVDSSFASNNSCKAYYQSKNSSISIEESPNYHLFSKKVAALLTWMSNEDLTSISFKTFIMDDLSLHHAIDTGSKRAEAITNLISQESPLQKAINDRVNVFNKRVTDLSAKIQEFKNTDSAKFKLKLVNRETFKLTKLKDIQDLFKALQDDLNFFEDHKSHFEDQSKQITVYYKQLVEREKAIEKLAQSITLYREILLRQSKNFPHLQTKIGIIATSLAQEISSLRSSLLITEKAKQDLDIKQSETEFMQQSVKLLKNQSIETIFVTQGMTTGIAEQLLVKLQETEKKRQDRIEKRKAMFDKIKSKFNKTIVIPTVGIAVLASSGYGYYKYEKSIEDANRAQQNQIIDEIQNLAPNQEQQRLMKKYENQMPESFLNSARLTQYSESDKSSFSFLLDKSITPGEVIYLINYLPNLANNYGERNLEDFLIGSINEIGKNLSRDYTADEAIDLESSLNSFTSSLKSSAPHLFYSAKESPIVNENTLKAALEEKLIRQKNYFAKDSKEKAVEDYHSRIMNQPRTTLSIKELRDLATLKANPTLKTMIYENMNGTSLLAFIRYLNQNKDLTFTNDDILYCMTILDNIENPIGRNPDAFEFDKKIMLEMLGTDITKPRSVTTAYNGTQDMPGFTADTRNSDLRFVILDKLLDRTKVERINVSEMKYYQVHIPTSKLNKENMIHDYDYDHATKSFLESKFASKFQVVQ